MTTGLLSPPDVAVVHPTGDLPRHSLGQQVWEWCLVNIRQPDGPDAGGPWRFTPEQARFVHRMYAVDGSGRFLHTRAVLRRAKGWGKALALDTPLPTPTGWTTMGAVRPGDELLDERGRPCVVLAATETMWDRPCYRLIFRDGTQVVADADHLWPVREFRHRYHDRVVTTREIADAGVVFARKLTTGRTKATKSGVARWRTLPTPALELPEVDLGLPAYLLGYWLGDGDSDSARLTVAESDVPFLMSAMAERGVDVRRQKNHQPSTARLSFRLDGHGTGQRALRALGVLKDKHIPMSAMRASRGQRLDLLRGLVDSDGHIQRGNGRVEITVVNHRLADGIVELVRTLGLSPTIRESDAKIDGRVVGRRWRVSFSAWSEEPVALLPRKAERLVPQGAPYAKIRTITDVEPVAPVPVRCIAVSSPSHLFLAGEGMVPTHNSPFMAALAIVELCGPCRFGWWEDGEPRAVKAAMPWVQIAGVSEKQTVNTMSMVLAMLEESPAVDEYGLDLGLTRIFSAAGGRLEPITASAPTAEGARPTFVVLDETHHWLPANGGEKLAAVIRRNLGKSRDGSARSVETTNAHEPGQDSVAERSFEAWRAQADGRTRRSRVLYDSRESGPVADLADEDRLMAGLRAAYGDSTWVDLERVRDEIYDPVNSPSTSRRFYLNQVIAAEDAWVAPHQWDACADPGLVLVDGDRVAMFFDGGKTDDATGLVACRISDGALFTLGLWQRPEGPSSAGWQVDRSDVDRVVARAFDELDVAAFYADVALWESYVDAWRDLYADRVDVWATTGAGKRGHAVAWDMRSRAAEFTAAAERFLADVEAGAVRHDGDPRLTSHVIHARRAPNRWGISVRKEHRESPRKIDLAVCAIGARKARADVLAVAANSPRVPRRTGRVAGF